MDLDAKDRILRQREERHRHNNFVIRCMIAFMLIIAGILIAIFIKAGVIDGQLDETIHHVKSTLSGKSSRQEDGGQEADEDDGTVKEPVKDEQAIAKQTMEDAAFLASQYNYDEAIALLQDSEYFATHTDMQTAVTQYRNLKDSCLSYPVDQVTHVFFHTLIKDTSLAYDGDSDEAGYNQFMASIDEFNKIIESMYERGYVMVSPHDMCNVDADGNVTKKELMLPAGKTPFVLSQDDVSYYHYMDGDGFAQKLIVDTDGKVRNTYIEADGSVTIGDFDMVPLIDRFVEEHPDFAYHGHKGVVALTGYEGVLGYRTDEVYQTKEQSRLTEYQIKFLEENPDFDFDKEVAEATKVATAMKEEGWEFASHTWGHINPLGYGYDSVVADTKHYKDCMEPIIGKTDILIFAFGADLGDWRPYSDDNEYFTFYKSQGFNIFCNVDRSKKYWVQFGEKFMRQARRNIDGYAMYYDPEGFSDLFKTEEVYDQNRPAVPDIG